MYIGIDIGGTNVRIASTDSLAAPRIIDKTAFQSEPSYSANIKKIKDAINSFPGAVEGIGIGTPGKLNDAKTRIIFTRYAEQWVGQPLVQDLTSAFQCIVTADGDSVTGALGEALYGNGNGKSFRYITYGTGIGSAMVTFQSDKPRIQKATDEEHATYLNPWQHECGGRGIERTMGKPAALLSEDEWAVVMDKFHSHLVTFLAYFKPRHVVFGSGVAVKQWPRIKAVTDKINAESPNMQTDFTLTQLGEDTGLYGAFGLLEH